ncbi:MAG: dihydrodipicolinate synthase family protein, partial [Mesorhizobium sp.]
VWGAVMLAIDDRGAIDWDATGETVARLCASGVDGIYSNGTACEFHCQTEPEFDRLCDLVATIAGRARLPPSDDEVMRFVGGLGETAPDMPLVLYNPPHAKRRLTLEGIARLRAAVPSLVGAKLPGGDTSWYSDMRRELPGFSVFVPGHTLATGFAQGAHGSYSNVACLNPKG